MRITKLKLVAFVALVGAASGGTAAVGSIGSSSAPVSTQSDPDVLRIIYTVGVNHGASDFVMLAAFKTCVTESHCRNLPDGDADSAGVFQQRPSMGWGTWQQVTNVQYAARQFFVRAIANQHCCATSGQLAQTVQRSRYPDRYDQNESLARAQMAKGRALHLKWLRTHRSNP